MLSDLNNWKHEFKNLPKYRADGSLINYTVKEDAVVNYDTDIAGNANDGFKIKNSNFLLLKTFIIITIIIIQHILQRKALLKTSIKQMAKSVLQGLPGLQELLRS